MRLATRLKQARERAGFTRATAARRAGTTRQTIDNIENGKHSPGVWVLFALAKAYGVSLDELAFANVRDWRAAMQADP